ncbi:MAG: type II toxin-antitoxin system HigB family toxin [Bacteroidia bacterium]|nr:type II toxin-antitoxin system HigB family toxin [Bacteroidia bacterium]
MEITHRYKLDDFVKKHSDVLNPLNNWIEHIEKAQWKNHNELKADFPSVDYVTNSRFVFNIKGNNYRIVVVLVFFAKELNIRFAGTHAEYDKIDARTI